MQAFNSKIAAATRTKTATIKANADTTIANAKMAVAARDRTSKIKPEVDQNALGMAMRAFGGLVGSAGAAATGVSRHVREMILITGAIGTLAAPAIGVLGTALLGIPGAVSVAGAAITAIVLGMDGIKRAAAIAAPALGALKAAVSATFYAGMVPVFQQIANVLLPGITRGMQGIAGSLSFLAQRFIGVVTSAAGMGMINTILANTSAFLGRIAPMIGGFTNGFLRLSVIGSGALLGFAVILNNFGIQFDEMTQRLAASGVLTEAFNQLGISVGILLGFFLRLMEASAGMMARLGPEFNAFLWALTNGLIAVLPLFESFSYWVMAIVTPLINFLLPALGWMAPVLGPIAAVLFLVGIAMTIVGAIMWALNTAVVTATWSLIRMGVAWLIGLGPIFWIIAAIAALVGGFIWLWTTCDWFRNFWIGLWNGIVAIAQWAWYTIMLPIFAAMSWFVGIVGQAFMWLWGVAVGAWNAIGAALAWVWNVILFPVLNAIGFALRILAAVLFTILVYPWLAAWNLLSGATMWAWSNIISPVFGWIGGLASWLWNNVLRPIFGFIGAAWLALWRGVAWAWNFVGALAWNAIAAAAGWLWNNALAPIFRAIGVAWRVLMDGVRWVVDFILIPAWRAAQAAAVWLWVNVLRPTFGAIGAGWRALIDGIRWVWAYVLRPCWDAVAAAANWLGGVLARVFGFIGDAWRGLVRGIDAVWNTVLRVCWNAIQGAAQWMWGNVLRPVFGAIGAAWGGLLNGMNALWRNVLSPMFGAIGSAVNAVARGFEAAVNWIRDIWNRMIAITANPINFVIDAVYNRGIVPAWGKIAGWLGLPGLQPAQTIKFATGGKVPGSGNRDTVPAMLMPGEYVISKKVVDQWGMDNIHAAHQTARSGKTRNSAYATGGPVQHFAEGGHVWPQLWGMVKKQFPDISLTSNYRPGDSGYHGKGMAVDVGYGNYGKHAGVAEWIARSFPNATQLISAQFRGGLGILNGQPHNYGGATTAAHRNHVHWAMTPAALGGAAGGGGIFDIVGLVVDWFRNTLMKPTMDTAGGMLGKFGNNPYTQGANKIPGKALDLGTDWVKGKANDIWGHIAHLFSWMFGGGGGGGAGGGAEQWRGLVMAALARLGLPASWADVTLRQIQSESGGNPRAVNNWDSNARKGTPSGGLLQTIAPTFAANRDPGLANNMFDPFANIVASMRYAMGRYGSLPAAYRGVGYAKGGPVVPSLFDNGGILPPTPSGYGLYANHTGRKEAVLTNEQMQWLRGAANNGGSTGGDIITTVNARTDATPEHIAHSINRHVGMKLRS